MVSAVGFPVPALGAPPGTAIALADEDISAVERLQAGAVRVRIGRDPWQSLEVTPSLLYLLAFLVEGLSLGRQGDEAGFELNGKESSEVCCKGEGEEDKVEDQENDCDGRLFLFSKKIVDFPFLLIIRHAGSEQAGYHIPQRCATVR